VAKFNQKADDFCKSAPQLMTLLMDGLSHMGDGMIDAWSESYGRWDDRCIGRTIGLMPIASSETNVKNGSGNC
jgi:hypothetical protein